MSLDNITLDGVSLASPAPCSSGKVQHKDQASAEAHALSIQQKDGHLPNVFVCAECGFFHVGGGRKSDRPAYRQPSMIPVLPPAKLPRKEYQRRKIEEGVSYDVTDVLAEYYETHPDARDREVAQVFGLDFDTVWKLRRAAGIGTRSQRCEKKILAALQADPSVNRGELSKRLNIPPSMIEGKVKQLGFAGTGKGKSQAASRNPMAGVTHSQESRNKISAGRIAHLAKPEERARSKQLMDRVRRTSNPAPSPKELAAWSRNIHAANEVSQTPSAKAKRVASIKAFWNSRTPEERATANEKRTRLLREVSETPSAKAKRAVSIKAFWGSRTPEEIAQSREKRSRETKARAPQKLYAGAHINWHVNRGITKAGCPLCVVTLQANELLNPQVSASR